MDRKDWDCEFIKIIGKRAGITGQLAIDLADAADDSFNDNDSPSDAVDHELSYWVD